MEEKQALDYLVKLGEEKEPILDLAQGTFSRVPLTRITDARAKTLTISTLTGLVDYIKSDIDKLGIELLVHVKSCEEVNLYGPLNRDRERELFINAQATLPENIIFSRFLDTEQFNIMLQSSFTDQADKEILLKYTGLIKDDAVKTTGDDGISQAVTIKTGVASVGQAILPNPVQLAPYRSFTEIEQPISKFIFRMQDGPKAALFEADGGAWRNEAMLRIKNYLIEQLSDVKNVQIIS